MPQTEDIEYIKKYEAYDCINTSEDDDFDPLDELYEPDPVEIQNTSQNPFTAKVFDPETMLFDLAEARKTETKFRENILSMMMSVLISSDKPNALLCGPAGCGKTKIVEELAYRLENSENIVPQLKGGIPAGIHAVIERTVTPVIVGIGAAVFADKLPDDSLCCRPFLCVDDSAAVPVAGRRTVIGAGITAGQRQCDSALHRCRQIVPTPAAALDIAAAVIGVDAGLDAIRHRSVGVLNVIQGTAASEAAGS